MKLKGSCVSGKLESGILKAKHNYVIMPQGILCQVKDILVNDLAGNSHLRDADKVPVAYVGQMLDCSLTFDKKYEVN